MRSTSWIPVALALLLPAFPSLGAPPVSDDGEPVLRIGIGELYERVELAAEGGIRIKAVGPDAEAIVRVPPPTSLVVEPHGAGGRMPEPAPLFRVMFSTSPQEATVRRVAAWVRSWMPEVDVVVFHNEERDAWRAYAGAFSTRSDASTLVPRLAHHGLDRLWITERTAEEAERRSADGGLRIAMDGDGSFADVLESGRVVRFEAMREGDVLRLAGVAYRGTLEVRTGPPGTVRVVNELKMEDYLCGVVPKEMSPGLFPQLEALKAQAVAARTYAYRHLGQFANLGFDLCDSQRCQAYGGFDAEQRLSDRAVRETRGRVLMSGGEPIRAFYTASCGGHTEDVEEMFPEETGAYLRGAPCPTEASPGLAIRARAPVDVFRAPDGGYLNYALAWLVVRDAVPADVLRRELGWAAPGAEWQGWARSLASLAGKGGGRPGELSAVSPAVGSGAGSRGASRAERLAGAASLLWSGTDEESGGRVLSVREGAVRVRTAAGTRELAPSALEYLFVRSSTGETDEPSLERAKPVAALVLRKGDDIRWVEGPDGTPRILIAEGDAAAIRGRLFPRRGGWTASRSSAELLSRLSSRTGITRVSGLFPLRLTPSGRVSEVEILSPSTSQRLRGIRVRWGLGLRENLFDPYALGLWTPEEGLSVPGHGWGHGVGLCQTGTGGLARRGSGYEQILTHYYPGADLARLW